jgi:hypothetical protein
MPSTLCSNVGISHVTDGRDSICSQVSAALEHAQHVFLHCHYCLLQKRVVIITGVIITIIFLVKKTT